MSNLSIRQLGIHVETSERRIQNREVSNNKNEQIREKKMHCLQSFEPTQPLITHTNKSLIINMTIYDIYEIFIGNTKNKSMLILIKCRSIAIVAAATAEATHHSTHTQFGWQFHAIGTATTTSSSSSL